MINHPGSRDSEKASCAARWAHRQWRRNVEQHMVTVQMDAGSSLFRASCGCRAGGTGKILTMQGEYFCMCFHLCPTGLCCRSAVNWLIMLGDRVYSARLCIISHSKPHKAFVRRYSQLPIHTLLHRGLPADKWPVGEAQGEPCPRVSQRRAAAAIWDVSKTDRKRQRKREDVNEIYIISPNVHCPWDRKSVV